MTATRFKVDQHDVGTFSTALRHTFQASNFQFTDIPASLQNANGFADNPSSSQFVRGGLSRFNFNVDASRYGNWHGQHTLKGGLQVERIVDDTLSGEQAATVQLFWDQSYALNDGRRIRGTYGYYNVVRFVTIGDIESNNVGLFVQDAWTLNRKLTLNLGIRTESEDVPSYRADNPGVHFGFGDKLAPRVGFAYDLRGDSQWKTLRQLGRLLRPDEADHRPRHVRRRQLGQLLLHARQLELAGDFLRRRRARERLSGHVHHAVRLPSRGQQPDARPRRSRPQGGAVAGVHARASITS